MPWDMIGHEWAVNLLRDHLVSKSVRHAYLFTGPDSVGKRTLALRFAQALNCEAPPDPGGICGECRACKLIATQTYPDLHVVEVGQLDSLQELNHSSTKVKVKQIRLLQRQLALAPYEGRWRIALLLRFWEASESAANALLKTLEEPASQVILLLTARSTESLLPTIVSRCEVIPLRAIAREELESGLMARGETEERAKLLAGLAAGRPGWALCVGEDPERLQRRVALIEDMFSLLAKNQSDRFGYVVKFRPSKMEGLQSVRERAIETLETWLSFWRDAMILAFDAQASVQNPDRESDLKRLTYILEPEKVVRALQATERTLKAVHQFANIQLAMETLMLDLPRLELGQ